MPTRDLLSRSLALLVAVLALATLGTLPAFADGPLSLVTSVPVGALTHDIDLQGQFMYVATADGVTVVDLTTPNSPVVRGSLATTTLNMGIKVRGNYAYVAGFGGGFRVVDISDPDAPVLKATRAAGYAYAVALKDNIAYVVSFAGELYVFDITDPLNPSLVRTLGLPAWKGSGTTSTGLTSLRNYATAGNAKGTGVTVKGNVLLATDWAYGRIYYWDVTTASSPVFGGTHYAPYIMQVDVDLDHDVIYMLSAYLAGSGIYTVPLSYLSPTVATEHATCPVCSYLASTVPTVGLDQGGLALAAGGKYLVYGGGRNTGEFHVVNVTDPMAMTYAATVAIGVHGVPLSQIMGVRTDDDRIYFSAGNLGVQVYQFPGLGGTFTPPPPNTTPVVNSFAINAGAASATSRIVTLNNSVSGGTPVQYRASESSNLTGVAWLPYSTSPSFTLSSGNASKQVFFQVRTADPIESAVVNDAITLNEPVPNVTLFAINNGGGTTTTRTVTLNNTAANNPTEYRASESSTFVGASWLPYSAAPSFQLSPGAATKRVYFQARNAAGTSLVRSDTIILNVPTPVLKTMAINGGVSTTTVLTVTLNNTTSGSTPTQYRASESSTFVGASWLPYSTAPSFTLSSGNATKRVYLQVRDADGAMSNVLSDTIILSQ